MRTVFKYVVPSGPMPRNVKIIMPEGAIVRVFGKDPKGLLCIWAEVDTRRNDATHEFLVLDTGGFIPNEVSHNYVASCVDEYVRHLYRPNPKG